jgi:predicted TIM-barrel enzyme
MHMKIIGDIQLTYDSSKQAHIIQDAVKIDDGTFVSSTIKDATLHAHIESDKVSSFLQTVDDYLSCVSVSESVVNKQQKD